MAYLDNVAVFVRVVELGNLSSAGRDMRISPAVASNRVKELEKHLGVRLFNRTTRSVALSEAGRDFLARIGPALREIEGAIDAAKSGVNAVHIIDGRVPHAMLLEIFTKQGAGTLVRR